MLMLALMLLNYDALIDAAAHADANAAADTY